MDYVTFGVHFCIECFCNREFVAYEENQRDAKFAECYFCGFMWGVKRDEHVIDPETKKYVTVESNVLTEDVVRVAQAKRVAEWRKSALSTGVRLEAFSGR